LSFVVPFLLNKSQKDKIWYWGFEQHRGGAKRSNPINICWAQHQSKSIYCNSVDFEFDFLHNCLIISLSLFPSYTLVVHPSSTKFFFFFFFFFFFWKENSLMSIGPDILSYPHKKLWVDGDTNILSSLLILHMLFNILNFKKYYIILLTTYHFQQYHTIYYVYLCE